jgi:hypothetical protein
MAARGLGKTPGEAAASIRFGNGSVREVPFTWLRLADFTGSVPWRRFRSVRGQAHYSGSYASATTGGHVLYESRLELARLLLADFDTRVRGIYAQPCLVTAVIGGRARRHVPDFLLAVSPGVARVVNVKPAGLLKDPKITEACPGRVSWWNSMAGSTRSGLGRILFWWRMCGSWPPIAVWAWWTRLRSSGPGGACGTGISWRRPSFGWPAGGRGARRARR